MTKNTLYIRIIKLFYQINKKDVRITQNLYSISEKTPVQRSGLNTYLTNGSSHPRRELLFVRYVFFENRPTFAPKGKMTAGPSGA
jgi:hypothetical protein